jgi:glycosyltransferase involved in cell wall biosynthesis
VTRKQPADTIPWPSFSIVIETENLSMTEIEGLVESLDSLAQQSPSPAEANEVMIIESGDTPAEVLEHIQRKYPWVNVVFIDLDIDYYDAKIEGARRASGEVVVYADSDCIYEPNWLRSMLIPFGAYPDIQVLGGETAIRGSGPYVLANAISYFFDGHSYRHDLYSSSTYFFNNVAFRRQFLVQNPTDPDLPLYRGHCVLHTLQLRNKGVEIWRQPRARAHHAPPHGLFNFFWRYILIGRDNAIMRTLLPPSAATAAKRGRGTKLQKLSQRIKVNIKMHPISAIWLPIALPIAAVSLLLVWMGDRITRSRPDYLLETFKRQAARTQ